MILTPAEQYLAASIGISEDDFILFKLETQKASKIEPGKPQAGLETLLTISLVSTLLSVGFAIAASFFKPKGSKGGSPEIRNTVAEAINRTANQKFVPRTGFDSSQDPVNLGDTIPVVYTVQKYRSEDLPPYRCPGSYGGTRFNLLLLWSYMKTIDGSMFLRSLFALSESQIKTIDKRSFAIGDNTITSYVNPDAPANNSERFSIYFKPTTGRITSSDYLVGKDPSFDPGNTELEGGPDVFCLPVPKSATPSSDYSYVSKPTTQTVFGLYAHAPNFMGLRLNVNLRPTLSIQTKKAGDASFRVEVVDDPQALADIWKGKYMYSYRMGVSEKSSGGTSLNVGDTFKYVIKKESDQRTQIIFDLFNTNALFVTNPQGVPPLGKAVLSDVAASVSARQKTVYDSLNVGEVYMCGAALCVIDSKSPNDRVFVSDGDGEPYGGGQSIEYTFRCIRAGAFSEPCSTAYLNPDYTGTQIRPPYYFPFFDFAALTDKPFWFTASAKAQIFKVAIATVRIPRETDIIDIVIRSTIGIRVNGASNYKDTDNLFTINWNAGSRYSGGVYPSDATLFTSTPSTGRVSSNEIRYSFWTVQFRLPGTDTFHSYPALVGVRGNSGEAVYNSLTMGMPYVTYWELRLEPVSSFAIRTVYGNQPLLILDSTVFNTVTHTGAVPSVGSVTLKWKGVSLPSIAGGLDTNLFKLSALEPNQNLLRYTEGNTMFGEWMGIDESCVFEEVGTTVGNSPEHEIVIVNNVTRNDDIAPQYDDISKIGLNIQASLEWQQLNQVSVLVKEGRQARQLLYSDAIDSINLFPDVFRDLLSNKRFGTGNIVTDLCINTPDFIEAAQFNQDRFYFFDGAITEKVNLREWAAEVAPYFLLELLQIEGQFSLKPLLPPFEDTVPINGLFNAGNIKKGSFSLEFIEDEDRQPIAINIKYREIRNSTDISSDFAFNGFPEEVQLYVREANTPDNIPVEDIDVSAYVTNCYHAIDIAAAFIRIRSLITHKIKFTTGLGGIDKPITAGVYIKVPVDYTTYNEFSSGIILSDGRVVTSLPGVIADGTYSVLSWDYTDAEVVNLTISITNGVADVTNKLISIPNSNTQENVYKIESVLVDDDGAIVVEAIHSPVNTLGYSLLTRNWPTYKTDANWIIEPGCRCVGSGVAPPPPPPVYISLLYERKSFWWNHPWEPGGGGIVSPSGGPYVSQGGSGLILVGRVEFDYVETGAVDGLLDPDAYEEGRDGIWYKIYDMDNNFVYDYFEGFQVEFPIGERYTSLGTYSFELLRSTATAFDLDMNPIPFPPP